MYLHMYCIIGRNRMVLITLAICFAGLDTTTEQAFGHLPKMNNNLGQNRVRD